MVEKIIDFLKGLMQPAITVLAIYLLWGLATSGYSPDNIFKVVVGVLGFWFGFKLIKDFTYNGNGSSPSNKVNGNGTLPKANGGQSTAAADDVSAVGEEPYEPFDIAAFHTRVLEDVKGTHQEENPATIFYEARDKGAITKCQHISQAVDFWHYLVDLAVEAKDWVKEQENMTATCTSCGSGCKGRTPESYVFSCDFTATMNASYNLTELAESKIDWKTKLTPSNCTLYKVGVLAAELLGK